MDDSRSTVDYLTSDLNFSSKSSIRSTIEYLTTDLNFSSNSSIRKNCFLTFLQLMAYTLDDGRHTAIPDHLFQRLKLRKCIYVRVYFMYNVKRITFTIKSS
ncbi:uncharacterized protein [Solanum lycopersicum]|uniref:uncharacterized protein isoform X9 n=1 Tax=Solanum lycopersicum TaxID=4081 RepID=UPI000E1C4EDA|nr:uncharacterized protein LOC104646925 isoform X2 [Solanum lycopersicum]